MSGGHGFMPGDEDPPPPMRRRELVAVIVVLTIGVIGLLTMILW
jgi:hypothetical protein